MEAILNTTFAELLRQPAGVVILILVGLGVLELARLRRELSILAVRWDAHNNRSETQIGLLQRGLDALTQAVQDIRDQLQLHSEEIADLRRHQMVEQRRELVGRLARDPPEATYGPVTADDVENRR